MQTKYILFAQNFVLQGIEILDKCTKKDQKLLFSFDGADVSAGRILSRI